MSKADNHTYVCTHVYCTIEVLFLLWIGCKQMPAVGWRKYNMAATIFNSGHHCLPNGVTFLVEKKNIPTPFLVATASHYYLMIATYAARAHG